MMQGLHVEINRQVAARRALPEWVLSWLEQRAGGYNEDAAWLDRLHRLWSAGR